MGKEHLWRMMKIPGTKNSFFCLKVIERARKMVFTQRGIST